ncbi:C40 family peptidase [Enterococcus faecalis]|nr:C40 family peptidase [Enterococcus faecalis]
MKKFLFFLGSLLILLFVGIGHSPGVFADDLDDLINKQVLTGKELDDFENAEKQNLYRSKYSVTNYAELQSEYDKLVSDGFIGSDVTFDMYVQMATTPPPTDPVAPEFRGKTTRGLSDLLPGDFLVTNGTSFGGLTGHAGIYVGNGLVMSIQGGNYHPATMHLMEWMYTYNKAGKWTKVYRPAGQYRPALAAQWAMNNYNGSGYKYGITTNIFGKNPTYCSKIVWQAYYYASAAAQVGGMKQPLIAAPYDLPNYFNNVPVHTQTWKG